jgi:hypothetical protein
VPGDTVVAFILEFVGAAWVMLATVQLYVHLVTKVHAVVGAIVDAAIVDAAIVDAAIVDAAIVDAAIVDAAIVDAALVRLVTTVAPLLTVPFPVMFELF